MFEDEKRARKLAFYVLFSARTGNMDEDYTLKRMLESDESEGVRGLLATKVLTWKKHAESIDNIIESKLRRGSISDMAAVAISVLRIGLAEMEYCDDVPPQVAINEAVELAKTYGDPSQGGLVNGLLDARLKELNVKGDGDGRNG